MKQAISAAGFFVIITALFLSDANANQHFGDVHLVLKVGDRVWEYHYEQLKPLFTKTVLSTRGTKKNPAVPLNVLLTKDTKLPMERILGVVFVADDRVLFLEGDNLKLLSHLLLKLGDNHLTLTPENDETYRAIKPFLGKHHLSGVERIDIFQTRDGH
jgi:hypothetical protein